MALELPEHEDELKKVKLPSGAEFQVYAQEVSYFNKLSKTYLKDNKLTNVSDLQDMDRILSFELVCWRYINWISRQRDYWDEPVDEKELNRLVKDLSGEVRQIKAALGLDKVSRDKVRGENSVAEYIEQLRVRAKAFGYMRNKQLDRAIELSQELIAKITLYNNCTEDERKELKCTKEDIFKWIELVYVQKFQAVDEHFRENEQKLWIRQM